MEFVQGQVFNMEKVTELLKKSKEKKHLTKLNEQLAHIVNHATQERNFLENRIEYNCDKDLLEADIYRLKAAEILQNYHIKIAKQQFNQQNGGQL